MLTFSAKPSSCPSGFRCLLILCLRRLNTGIHKRHSALHPAAGHLCLGICVFLSLRQIRIIVSRFKKKKLDDQKMKIFYMYIVKERESRFLETRVFVKYYFHSPLFLKYTLKFQSRVVNI